MAPDVVVIEARETGRDDHPIDINREGDRKPQRPGARYRVALRRLYRQVKANRTENSRAVSLNAIPGMHSFTCMTCADPREAAGLP
jgi:hypothetical protein